MKTHKCPASGCEQRQPMNLLMCAHHWHMVPLAIQRLVLDSWKHGGAKKYLEARAKAIAAVNEALKGEAEAEP